MRALLVDKAPPLAEAIEPKRRLYFFKRLRDVPINAPAFLSDRPPAEAMKRVEELASGEIQELYLPVGLATGWRHPGLTTENAEVHFCGVEEEWLPQEMAQARARLARVPDVPPQTFVVKHYVSDEHPSLMGCGYDLFVADDREEVQEFADLLNSLLVRTPMRLDVAVENVKADGS